MKKILEKKKKRKRKKKRKEKRNYIHTSNDKAEWPPHASLCHPENTRRIKPSTAKHVKSTSLALCAAQSESLRKGPQ